MLKRKPIRPVAVNFIGAYFLDNLNVCDDLIDFFKNNKERQFKGRQGFGIDEEIKKSTDLPLFPTENTPAWDSYKDELTKVIKCYSDEFDYAMHVAEFGVIETTNIQYYKPNEAYFGWHKERSAGLLPQVARHLAFMTYLNDVNDQGETEFYYQNLKIKPEKGLTLIWPVDWTHTHRGVPSPSEEKYIITGWLTFTEINRKKSEIEPDEDTKRFFELSKIYGKST